MASVKQAPDTGTLAVNVVADVTPVSLLSEDDLRRFWDKVDAEGDCWVWTAGRVENYGTFGVNRSDLYARWRAHRLAWELLVGPIAPGLTVDHLCRNTLCVNPDHLEPVTIRINALRGFSPTIVEHRRRQALPPKVKRGQETHCRHGHPYSGDNLAIQIHHGRRVRRCRACNLRGYHERRRRVQAVAQ